MSAQTDERQTLTARIRAAGSDMDGLGPPPEGRYYIVLDAPCENEMLQQALFAGRLEVGAPMNGRTRLDAARTHEEIVLQLGHRALDKWGVDEQMRQAAEECIELALAVRHFETCKVGWEAVAEEVAGVEIMLAQLLLLVPGGALDVARAQQVEKLVAALGVTS